MPDATQMIFTKILASCGLAALFFQGSARGRAPCLLRFTLRYLQISDDCAVLSSDESTREICWLKKWRRSRKTHGHTYQKLASERQRFWGFMQLGNICCFSLEPDTIHPSTMVDTFGCLDQSDFTLDLCGWYHFEKLRYWGRWSGNHNCTWFCCCLCGRFSAVWTPWA